MPALVRKKLEKRTCFNNGKEENLWTNRGSALGLGSGAGSSTGESA